ncbi:MAG: nitrate- and nitrite sensing domain-containing protein [Flavobacteriales bacterium]|nr:nitrate- and nitrite sensing domain-containing protein [Flavobacteriales bacterium]
MASRFADLPIRTKFLVTLGIPVLGLVLLIGKQVDSNLKRSDVLGYMSGQARYMRVIGDVLNGIQNEGAVTVATMEQVLPNDHPLELARVQSDDAMKRLGDPNVELGEGPFPTDQLRELGAFRSRVDKRSIPVQQAAAAYLAMEASLLGDIVEVSKRAIDLGTNNQLFAHQSLLHAKQALCGIRMDILQGLAGDPDHARMSALIGRMALYETSMTLFQRDASPEVLEQYEHIFQGPEVNFLKAVIGTVQEKRSLEGLGINAAEWWEVSGKATARLREVEVHSVDSIIKASGGISEAARQRLFLVLVALLMVVGAVVVMAVVITRTLRSTISEVTLAASALAQGDVRATVHVNSADEVGQMVGSFNQMIEAIRSLSASADAIGKGNYDTPVPVRGEQDVLGLSLKRMQENLRAARDRDKENNQALLREKEKLERANERIRVLIREIHHRVKNNLQVVSSMLRLQAANIHDEELRQSFAQSQNRVASMALIHERLYKGDDLAQVDLSAYIRDLFTELIQMNKVEERIRYRTAIDPDLVLNLDTMVPLGLILNELITNSFKHAFIGRQDGFINLRIHRVENGAFDLHYSDDGKGIPADRQGDHTGTLGRSLIDSLVEQLNGFITMESDATGTRYHIRFQALR